MPPSHESPRCSHQTFGRSSKKLVRDSSIPALLGDCVDLASADRDARISTSSLCSSVLSLSNSLIVPLTSESVLNISFKALVDSGSTDCFIESAFVRKHNLTPFSVPNIPLKLFDGTTNSVISEAIELPIRFASSETLVLRFLLTSLDKSCAVVLDTIGSPDTIPRLTGYWVKSHSTCTNPNEPPNPRYPLVRRTTAVDAPNLHPPKYPHEFAPSPVSFINAAAFSLLCKRSDTWTYRLDISAPEVSARSISEGTNKPPIPEVYSDFTDVFSKAKAGSLAPHQPYDLKIVTPNGVVPPHGRMYLLSETETKALREFLNEHLASGFIRPSRSPHGTPVLFVKKRDGSLRLCVDFRGLNKITQKDRYPLSLITNLLDAPQKACIYTKIDLQHAYHLVQIAEGDEWKTTFRTHWGSFEWNVMPFSLSNAPAAFQRFMNNVFGDLLDVCAVVYLDDILIYSDNLAEHQQHVRKVLTRLCKHGLFATAEKCEFHVETTEFLAYILMPNGLQMGQEKVQTIQDWPASEGS